MYKALKIAQTEIQESLLKFADEVNSFDKKVQNDCPRSPASPCRCALITQSVSSPVVQKQTQYNESNEMIERTLQYMIEKHDSQYAVLVGGIQDLNVSLKNIANLLIAQAEKGEQIVTSSTIPNIQPVSQDSDLKTVCVLGMEDSDVDEQSEDDQEEEVISVDIEEQLNTAVDIDEEAEVEAEVAEAEAELAEVKAQLEKAKAEAELEAELAEAEAEAEVEAEQSEDDAEGIEVEEWTYKGRVFFKDTENTVYANNAGEAGDPIGKYDSVKNIVRPLKN